LNLQAEDIQLIIGINKKNHLSKTILSTCITIFLIRVIGSFLAVGDSDIGIDVEKIDPDFSYEDILATGFSVSEINLIKKSASPRSYFYLHWTRKEALTKATAKGLDDNLIAVPCLDGLHHCRR